MNRIPSARQRLSDTMYGFAAYQDRAQEFAQKQYYQSHSMYAYATPNVAPIAPPMPPPMPPQSMSVNAAPYVPPPYMSNMSVSATPYVPPPPTTMSASATPYVPPPPTTMSASAAPYVPPPMRQNEKTQVVKSDDLRNKSPIKRVSPPLPDNISGRKKVAYETRSVSTAELYNVVRGYCSPSDISRAHASRAVSMSSSRVVFSRRRDEVQTKERPKTSPLQPSTMFPIQYYSKEMMSGYEYEFNKNMIEIGRPDLILVFNEYDPSNDFDCETGQWYYRSIPVSEKAYWCKISKDSRAIKHAMENPTRISRYLMCSANENAFIFLEKYPYLVEYNALQHNYRSYEVYKKARHLISWEAMDASPDLFALVRKDIGEVDWTSPYSQKSSKYKSLGRLMASPE